MKKLIYNENIKEIDIIERGKEDCLEKREKENKDAKEKEANIIKKSFEKIEDKKDFKSHLEIIKTLCEIFSCVVLGIMGIVLTFAGNNINSQTKEIYQRQLKIMESEKKPHFSIRCTYLSDDANKVGYDGKITKYYYLITNEGERITDVHVQPESYIYFYIPTDIKGEYYIFKFRSHDFYSDDVRWVEEVKKDEKYGFFEYIIKNENKSEWECIAEFVLDYFPDMRCVQENIVSISYIDYMGEEKEEIFTFTDEAIRNKSDEEWCVLLDLDYGFDSDIESNKPAVEEAAEAAEKIKIEIENWLKKNKGLRGREISHITHFEYIK